MASCHRTLMVGFAALAMLALPVALQAQSLPYGNVSAGDGDGASADGDAASSRSSGSKRGARRTRVTPYIEALQIVEAELSPNDEVLTYTGIAVGVDGTVSGRNSAASASVRYERRFGWGKARDYDAVSGVAKGYTAVAPGVSVEAGGAAFVGSGDGSGGSRVAGFSRGGGSQQVYSAYAGPTVATQAGDVAIEGGYRVGYTRVESERRFETPTSVVTRGVHDDSIVHNAEIHAGVKPYDVLPVGVGVGAGYYREDISQLDQRVEDLHARADVTVPVAPDVALVGGVGYEKVEISSRDAVRDASGLPVQSPNGGFLVDKSEPRTIAYDVEGLIWDAGVIWRPSRRTALEAHVGRRYGSTSVYGTFSYQPGRSSFGVSVYDNVAGFGGQLNRALADLPAEFSVVRNPISGGFNGCVAALESNTCINSALGSLRSATFRSRGVMANYGYDAGRLSMGIAGGYDRRRFIAARGTILAAANGTIDETFWLNAFLSGQIDAESSFTTGAYATWLESDAGNQFDQSALGAAAQYQRLLARRISATAAIAIDSYSQPDPLEDVWNASALLGLRYSF